MVVLGIETSCDETSAAVVRADKTILSNIILSQTEEHAPFGGVVPEIAARSHLLHLEDIVRQALHDAQVTLDDLAGIAATGGPGLIGGLIVGIMMAKGLCMAKKIPFLPINHLEGHALTARLTEPVDFPYLLLLVSGGHCQFLIVEDVGCYTYLGGTLDDALGECLDKTARLLGYGYPGGPIIEKLALEGDPFAFSLPKPLAGTAGCSFSFSGLKTAARKVILEQQAKQTTFEADFCASLQYTIGKILQDRMANAILESRKIYPSLSQLVVGGGVAANLYFKEQLTTCATQHHMTVHTPPLSLCTDNAAMIAWTGVERLRKGLIGSLDFAPRPRWPLDALRQES